MIYFLKWCISKNFFEILELARRKNPSKLSFFQKRKKPNGIGKLMKQKRMGIEVSKLDRRF